MVYFNEKNKHPIYHLAIMPEYEFLRSKKRSGHI
jgi:hypothetical protein